MLLRALLPLALALLPAHAESPPTPTPSPFAPVIQPLENGQINWTELRLEVTTASERTVGAWKDRRVQEQDALERVGPLLEELARTLPVTRNEPYAQIADTKGTLLARLASGIHDWEVVETRYLGTKGVAMTAGLRLDLWLAPLLEHNAGPKVEPPPKDGPSGIVIDARGLRFVPAVVPELRTAGPNPVVLMSLSQLGKDDGQHRIPVLYVSDPADLRAIARAGARPVFLRANAAEPGVLVTTDPLPCSEAVFAQLVAGRRVVVVATAQ